jgi:hypothetical protein
VSRDARQSDRSLLRPGWLSIPAAHRDRRGGPHLSDDAGGHGERSGSGGDSRSTDLGADRVAASVFVDPMISGVPEIRVVVVQLDSEGCALSLSGEDRAPVAFLNLPAVAPCWNGLEEGADLQREILRLRACSEMRSDGLAPDNRWCCCGHLPCRVNRQLDKHGLDVALSAGRHAAERAKLAGVTRLVGVAPSISPAAECRRRTSDASARHAAHELSCLERCLTEPPDLFDPYDALRCRGRPEIAALVGVAIAAAQMGIPFCLPDPAGRVALDAALGLNPGVGAWLAPLPAERPASLLGPGRPRSLCAV